MLPYRSPGVVRYFEHNGCQVYDVAQALRDSGWNINFSSPVTNFDPPLQLVDRRNPQHRVRATSIVHSPVINMHMVFYEESGWQSLDNAVDQFKLLEESEGTKREWLTTATAVDEERRAWWRGIFGCDEIPLQSPVAQWVNVTEFDEPQLCYMVDVQALADGQRARLVAALAKRFDLPVDLVVRELDGGVPVRAERVVMMSSDFVALASAVIDDLLDDEDGYDPDLDAYWADMYGAGLDLEEGGE